VSKTHPAFRKAAACLQAFFVALFLLAASSAGAQLAGTGNIQGTVTDATGALVPGATVTLTDAANGVKRTTQTDAAGVYLFPNVEISKYDLQVSAPAFETYVQTNIVLEVGSNIAVNPVLKVGAQGEKIEVHADSLALQTEDSTFKQTIDQSTVEEMPLNGRQMSALITLSGGSSSAPGGDFTGSKYSYQTIAVSVAGGMGNTTEWKLDGGDENEYMGNGNLPFPFPDAVSQFSVESTALGAQSGSTHSGGLVNVVTRSGTSQYHGDAFEFIRNNYIDGTNFFSTTPDTLHQNMFGGTFGGPLIPWKHKEVFVFAGYQRLKADQSTNPLTMFIPTAANLTGDWSATNPPCVSNGAGGCSSGQQLYDPLTGDAIPGNKYPTQPTYNQQALNLMAYMPTNYANASNGEVSFKIPSETYDNEFVTRVDWTINPRNNFYARYFIDGYQAPSFFFKGGTDGGILVTSQAPGNYERVQTAVASEAFTWKPNLVNSFHAYGTKRVDLRESAPGINGNTLGITQYDEVPTNLELEVTGGIGAWNTYCGTCSNGFFNVDDEGAADDLTWIKGAHQVVLGGEFLKVHFNEVAGFQANGNYQFNGEFSGSGPLGGNVIGNGNLDFLWGAMDLFGQSKEQQLALRGPVPSMYIQDTYHATKRLTLAGGIRWEPEFMPRDQFNRGSVFSMAGFLADQVSSVYPKAPPGSFFYGDPGVSKTFTTNPIWNFNPNIGATWDPFGNGNTVIRGGLQVAYDEANFYTTNRNHQNPPFATNVNVNITGPICFSEPWLAGGTGYGCDQVGGTNTSPFPQPTVPTPATAVFPALGEWIEISSPYRVPDTLQWTLSVQHEFPRGWQAQIDYIGNHTSNMPVGTEMDPAIYTPGVWGAGLTGCGPVVTSGPAFAAVAAKYSAPGAACSVPGDQQLRYAFTEANPAYGNQYAGGSSNGMILVSTNAYANYNAMVATLQHRVSSTFVLLTNYTWSHCLNIADASGDWSSTPLMDPYEPHLDYARCGSDYRNVFNTSVIYTTAFSLNGVARWLADGWEIAPLLHITSGAPLNITDGVDISLTDTGNDRPNVVPGVNPKTGIKLQGGHNPASAATRGWLTATAFCSNQASCASYNVAPGTFGDLGRNAIDGPMYFQNDAEISRLFPIKERVNIRVRLEAFNFLNHPSFDNPGSSSAGSSATSLSSSTFGQISNTSIAARIFQGSVKVIF
jgi:Carboxypeptidase regulatory-like domain